MLIVGLPVLIAALSGTAAGSARASVLWLGTLGYLAYQAVLFCFATPLNNFFLIYVAYLGLALWSIVLLLRSIDLRVFADASRRGCRPDPWPSSPWSSR